MNLSSKERRRPANVRAVCLAPPKTQSVKILSSIVDTMIPHIAVGFRAMDPEGKPVHVFLDYLGYIADYKEASDPLDCYNHSGNAGCTHCSFRKKPGFEYSEFAYSSAIHSKNTSSSRSVVKHRQMRTAGISDAECNHLGIWETQRATRFTTPFVYLEEQVHSFQPGPGAFLSPIRPLYTAYGTSIIAPDHCIMNNIRYLMTAVFRSLPSNTLRAAFNGLLSSSRVENGFDPDTNIFADGSLTSVTFSSHYATFSLFQNCLFQLRAMYPTEMQGISQILYVLVSLMTRVVAAFYYFPSVEIDGEAAIDFVFISGRQGYFESVANLVREYLRVISVGRYQKVDHLKLLDVPNVHRLLELSINTLPAYGHISNVPDMLFEHRHQNLKGLHQRRRHPDAHIWALHMDLTDMWKRRIANAFFQAQDQLVRVLKTHEFVNSSWVSFLIQVGATIYSRP